MAKQEHPTARSAFHKLRDMLSVKRLVALLKPRSLRLGIAD